MARDPVAFFRFAGKHFALLADLFYSDKGLSDAEIYSLVVKHKSDDDPSADYLFNRLRKLLIIDEVPGETARWELTHPVKALLRFLYREQRLTSVEVLQGYLKALETSRAELLTGIQKGDRNEVLRAVTDVSETIERLRQDSSDNYSAILRTCMDVKADDKRKKPQERFEIVNRLWKKYLMPMQDLISVDKSIDGQLDGLESVLSSGMVRFGKHPEMIGVLKGARARILRMRRETTRDFHNAIEDILPLYQALKTDSEFTRGASTALKRIDKAGVTSLDLPGRLSVSHWRTDGLLSQSDLRALVYELSGYQPGIAVTVNTPESMENAVYRAPDEVRADLLKALPVNDLLEWLGMYCNNGSAAEVLRLYGCFFLDPPGVLKQKTELREYHINGTEMKSYPVGVLAR
jgi:hypothetical protein